MFARPLLPGSLRQVNRVLLYGLISTLIATFAAVGTLVASYLVPEYALIGLLAGSTLGALIALCDATIIGCVAGMVVGLILAIPTFLLLDFETAYLLVFILSLGGAIMGHPVSTWLGAEPDPEPPPDNPRAVSPS